MVKHTQNQRKMQWVKAEANADAMKVVRVDCRFVMPKLGQSKRKVRHRMKNSQHLCWLRLRVSSMFIDVCNTDISEALPDAEGKRRSKADAWAEGNSKSKAKAEAVCCGKI